MLNIKSKNTDRTLPDLPSGVKVEFEAMGEIYEGEFSHWTKTNEAYIRSEQLGKPVWRARSKFRLLEVVDMPSHSSIQISPAVRPGVMNSEPIKTFSINKRFSFLASLVKMTIKKQNLSLIVTGDGGLGKTHTVMEQIQIAGLDDSSDYHVIKGYSTAKGLYNTLYENSTKLIVFDDCDEVLLDNTARNLLKGALDSYDERVIHWVSQQRAAESEYPTSFTFEGQIIFISNMSRNRIPQALISRSTCIDVTMTVEEKMERMLTVLSRIKPNVSMDLKKEALAVLDKWKYQTSDLNFRTLIKIINIREAADEADSWEEMAEYMLLS